MNFSPLILNFLLYRFFPRAILTKNYHILEYGFSDRLMKNYACHRPTFIAIGGYLSIFTNLMTQMSEKYVNSSLKICLKESNTLYIIPSKYITGPYSLSL